MRLRYIGQQATTFRDAQLPSGALVRIGYLEPFQEFSVPDEVAEAYTRRDDIEEVAEQEASAATEDKPAKGRSKAPAESPVSDAQPEPSGAAETPSPAAE
jgi:hypothetical protein